MPRFGAYVRTVVRQPNVILQPTPETAGLPATQTLTRYPVAGSGDYLASTPGAVIEGLNVYGNIIVTVANVTIRNCRIRGRSGASAPTALVDAQSAAVTNLLIERCTIRPDAAAVSEWANGIDGHDFTARLNDISDVNDGIRVRNNASNTSNVSIIRNFIHDFAYISPAPGMSDNQSHNDAIQLIGAKNTTIQGNNIQAYYGTAGTHQPSVSTTLSPSGHTGVALACIMFNDGATGQVIEDNWLAGAWTPINTGDAAMAGLNLGRIWRNRFTKDSARAPRVLTSQTVDTGEGTPQANVWAEDLQPLAVARVAG